MSADILHVDLDAFYVSVERRRRPELRGAAVIVGGDGSRGVVLSCSYEARAAGVRNGMPSVRAKRLCPRAVFVRPEFAAYAEASRAFRAILDAFTPLVEPLSLDEAFCDVSGAHALYGSSEDVARAIRSRVSEELSLVCSVGGGPSKLVAKMASRACKPDGMLVVTDVDAFLRPMAVEELHGVGAATADRIKRLGLRTIGDVADAPPSLLRTAVGDQAGEHIHRLARGVDRRRVTPSGDAKSVGAEETFGEDVSDPERITAEILRLSDRVASRLVASGLAGKTVTLKIRLEDFQTHTRSTTLRRPTSDVWTIAETARQAFAGFQRGRRRIRLLGVTASNLVPADTPEQLSFETGPRYADAERALVDVRQRFGRQAISLARLVERGAGDDRESGGP